MPGGASRSFCSSVSRALPRARSPVRFLRVSGEERKSGALGVEGGRGADTDATRRRVRFAAAACQLRHAQPGSGHSE